jgi:hypothetical protein
MPFLTFLRTRTHTKHYCAVRTGGGVDLDYLGAATLYTGSAAAIAGIGRDAIGALHYQPPHDQL